jgi:serine/threonine protein phosphatase PrpC
VQVGDAEDAFLILASDGVWDELSTGAAVEVVARHLARHDAGEAPAGEPRDPVRPTVAPLNRHDSSAPLN